MAIFKVVISVEGSPDLDDALDRAAELGGYNYVDSTELVIVRAAGACKRCRQNQDPAAIPVHMQCFPAGTVVSGPKAVASVTRWYEGELVEIETRSGAVLASTPNHPVLAVQGWVPMGLLEQGDQVVSQGGSERGVVGDPDEYQQPALIEDVASSVGEPGSVGAACVPVSTLDFDGDGVGSDIAVIRADGLLRYCRHATFSEPGSQGALGVVDSEAVALAGASGARFGLEGLGHSSNGGVSGLGVPPVVFGAFVGGGDSVGLRRAPVVGESSDVLGDGVTACAVVGGERINGLSGAISLDQIVKVRRYPFSGHVYNLETRVGWYFAASIVAHNCNCRVELKDSGEIRSERI